MYTDYDPGNFDMISNLAGLPPSTQEASHFQYSAVGPSHSLTSQPQYTTVYSSPFGLPDIQPLTDLPPTVVSDHGTEAESFSKCTRCSKLFSNKEKLRKHSKTHTRRHACDVCGEKYRGAADKKDLDRHYWTRHTSWARDHNIPREESTCPNCTYEGRSDNVKRHKKRCSPKLK